MHRGHEGTRDNGLHRKMERIWQQAGRTRTRQCTAQTERQICKYRGVRRHDSAVLGRERGVYKGLKWGVARICGCYMTGPHDSHTHFNCKKGGKGKKQSRAPGAKRPREHKTKRCTCRQECSERSGNATWKYNVHARKEKCAGVKRTMQHGNKTCFEFLNWKTVALHMKGADRAHGCVTCTGKWHAHQTVQHTPLQTRRSSTVTFITQPPRFTDLVVTTVPTL